MKHWTDGLSAAAIRAELAQRQQEDEAWRTIAEFSDIGGPWERAWEHSELSEWFPGSLKRVDEYIEKERPK